MPSLTRIQGAPLPAAAELTPEDRYLPPDWSDRTDDVDGLLSLRVELVRAHRAGRIAREDESAVSGWLEWIDERVGIISRDQARRERERAEGRVRGARIWAMACAAAAVTLYLGDAGSSLVGVALAGLLLALFLLFLLSGPEQPDRVADANESYLSEL